MVNARTAEVEAAGALLRKAAAGAASRQRVAVVFIVVVRCKVLRIKIVRSVRYKK
jgi:hypothetical protein